MFISTFKSRKLTGLTFTFFLLTSLFVNKGWGQTTLLDPAGDGGFEGTHGWTLSAFGANENRWYVGTSQKTSGTNGCYVVSWNATTTYGYDAGNTQTGSHAYKSISFPAGATNIVLSFKVKGGCDLFSGSCYDRVKVGFSSSTPTGNSETGITNVWNQTAAISTHTTQTVNLNAATYAGTTQNLVITWLNDGSGTVTAGAIDEVSITYTPATPTVTLGSNQPAAANICPGQLKIPLQSFSLAVTNASGNLTNVGFTTTGTYAQADISKYQLWYGTTNSLASATQLGTDLASSGTAGARTFTAFTSPTLNSGSTYYFWITADIASGATSGRTIAVNAITTSNLTSTSTKAGTTTAGGTQTVAIPTTFYSNNAAANTVAQTLANWNSATDGSGCAPSSFTTAGQTFIVQNGHRYRPSATWTGSSTSIIRVASGGALDINAQSLSTWQRIEIAGTGVTSSGALLNGSASPASLSIPVTLTAVATVISSGAGGLTLTGNIDNGGFLLTVDGANATAISTGVISGSGGITKAGNGTLTLSGTNTYTGATNVTAGVLNIQNAQGTGTTAGGVVVTSGAALQLQSAAVGAEALSLAGTGISSDGALRFISGTNSWAGLITLTATSRINADAGTNTLDVASGSAITGTFNLTIGGAGNLTIADPIATSTGTLTKDGNGALTLSGANTYTGATNVTAGVLNIQNAQGTGTTAGGVVVTSGAALQLQGAAVGAEALSIAGTGISSDGALRFISGTNSWAGLITLTATSRINADAGTNTLDVTSGNAITGTFNLTIGGAGNLTIADPIATSTGTLTKDGNGALTFSGANTYSGGTNVNTGTLALSGSGTAGSGTITIASGANFDVSARTSTLALGISQNISISATGANSSATITVASLKGLTAGSTGGMTFTSYGGANGNSGTNAPLLVTGASAGALDISGDPITINTSTALAAGTYIIIAKGGSATGVAASSFGTLTIGGSGLASGLQGTLSVSSGQLILTVALAPVCTTGLYTTGCSGGDNIQNISIANLSQTSTGCTGGTGIADYTATTVNLAQGLAYNYTITCDYSSSENVGWWIDFNDNNSFGDAGEFVSSGQTGTGGTITGTVTISAGANIGNHRMRVRLVFNNAQSLSTSCTPYTYGETHDYTVNIAAPCTAPTTQASNITASSITSSSASINWTIGNGAGRVVYINSANSFTAPSTGDNPTANTVYASGQQCIFNGTGSGPISVTGLAAASTYWVRIYEYCSSTRTYQTVTGTNNPNSFTTSAPSAPANDACANATTLACATADLAGTTVNCVSETAPGTCVGSYGVWYKFTGDGQTTTISANSTMDIGLYIASGSCAGLTQLQCIDAGASGIETSTAFTASNGTTYYVYVAYYGAGTTTGTFTISRTCISPPANDVCSNATTLACSTTDLAGTTVNSVSETEPGICVGSYGVWYKFTGDGQSTTISANSAIDIGLYIASGSCAGLTQLQCIDAGASGIETSTAFTASNGTTYYVYVAYYGLGTTTGTFTISRTCSASSAPANDLCADATTLTVGSAVSNHSFVGATSSGGSYADGTYPDVWFKFTATCTGTLQVALTNSSSDADIYLYSNCSSTTNLLTGGATPANNETATASLTSGTVYYLRVVDFDQMASTYSLQLSVLAPGTPTSISISAGTEPTCQLTNGTTTTTYATTATNSTGFNWSVAPVGAGTINSTSGLMTWSNGYTGTATISVTANGCNGPSATTSRVVTVNPTVTTPTSITVSGTEPTCQLTSAGNTTDYNSTATVGTLSWSLIGITNTTGTLLASAINSSTGVVTWPNGWAGSVTINVVSTGCNGPSTATTRVVTVNPTVTTPTSITVSGSEPTCQLTSAGNTTDYNSTATVGTLSWSLTGITNTTGTLLASAINSSTGVVTWPNGWAGSVTINVVSTGCNGPSTATTRAVSVNPLPSAAGAISGTATVCQGQTGVVYSVSAISNVTGYTWTLPTGATITSGSGTNSITVSYSNSASSGNVTVQGTNSCGSGTVSSNYAVTVNPLPSAAGAISGTATVCQGQSGVSYSVPPISNATSYTWSYSGTGFTPSASTSLITGSYSASATSGNLTVTGVNSCGNGTVSATYAITVNPLPSAPTVGTIIQPTCTTSTGSVELSGLPASGSWTVTGSPSGSLSSSGTSGTVSGLTAGQTYSFTVTNSSTCTSTSSGNAVINTQPSTPSAPTSVTPSATTICHGNSVNLNATSAGNTINWYTVASDGSAIQTGVSSAADHSVSPTANTTYYAEAQNGSGCKSSRTATGLISVENPVAAVNTAIGTTLQTNDYMWVGQTDAVWSTTNNWRQFNGTNLVAAGSAPGSNNTNRIYVVQNATSSNCIFNATSLSLGGALGVTSLFVGTGTSLNLNNQNLDLSGNITINGTLTPGSGTITLSGGSNQTLDGTSALSFSNVTINKSGGTLTAQKDMTITGTLTLTSGILNMNSKTLTMGTSAANGIITGGSASSYIVALDGTTPSKVIHNVNTTSNATYSFPIGTGSAYTPVTVVMKGGTLSNASIQVWTKNSKVTGMSNDMSCYLNRSWFVEPTGITSPTYDIQLGFASGDFTGDPGFDLNPVKLSSSIWYKPSGSLIPNGTTQGTTIATSYVNSLTPTTSSGTVYWNGLTSFSEFGGAGGSSPLPVELASFAGSCEDGVVNLSWQTASEHNSSHFDIEKSRDGESWQVIETIPAAGNSNELLNYTAYDQVTNILNYYRLNQVDIDGTNKRYNPIAISCEAMQNGIFMTYPNPSIEGFNILINDKELEGELNMNIYTATGGITLQKRIEVKEGINVFMMNEKLLPGLYFIEVKDQYNNTKVIRHLIN